MRSNKLFKRRAAHRGCKKKVGTDFGELPSTCSGPEPVEGSRSVADSTRYHVAFTDKMYPNWSASGENPLKAGGPGSVMSGPTGIFNRQSKN
jgi:hypothetical protein